MDAYAVLKRLVLVAGLLLLPSVCWAQCNGIFANNTFCGNTSGSPSVGYPIPASSLVFGIIPGSTIVSPSTNGGYLWDNNGVVGDSLPGTGPLGTAAAENTGTSGATVPLNNGANTESGLWTFNAGLNVPTGQEYEFNGLQLGYGNGLAGFGTFAAQNYATPPAIGGTTPNAGAFTTLGASGAVSFTDLSSGTQVSCLGLTSAGAVVPVSGACGSGTGNVNGSGSSTVGDLPSINNATTTAIVDSKIPTSSLPQFNPLTYGAVGNGSTDDTAAWQSMCSAVQTAGGGWIVSPQGKTYLVNSATTSLLQTAFCPLNGVNGVRVDMNGSKFTSDMTAQFTVGGTATASDTLNVTFVSLLPSAAFSPQTVTVTVTASESTSAMASAIASGINGNSTLSSNSIAATSNGSVVNITPTGALVTWNIACSTSNFNCSGLSVTGSKTETLTPTIVYGFELENAQNVEINDLQGTSYSGYGDSNRDIGMRWVFCTNGGNASPAFGCSNLTVNRFNLSGGIGGVEITRTLGTGAWSYNIKANGYCQYMGYCFDNQADGINSDFTITTQDVGRSYIGYNVSSIKGTIYSTKSNRIAAYLDDVLVSAYGYGAAVDTDLSYDHTTGVDINYHNRLSDEYGEAFFALSHQQGDPTNSNIATQINNVHFNVDISWNNNTTTTFFEDSTFKGTSGDSSAGDISGNQELGIVFTGVVQGPSEQVGEACLASAASENACTGFSGLTTAIYSLRDLVTPGVAWYVGTGTILVAENFSDEYSGFSWDSGYPSAQTSFIGFVSQNGTTYEPTSCSGSPDSSFKVSYGMITAC